MASFYFVVLLCVVLFFDSTGVQAVPQLREEKLGSSRSGGMTSSKVSSHSRKVAMMMTSSGNNHLGGLEKTISGAPLQIPEERGRLYQPEANQQAGMPGGYVPQDVNDEDVQKAAKFACEQTFNAHFKPYNGTAETAIGGQDKHSHRYQVVQASTQVVAGINYKLMVDVYKPDDEFGLIHCSVESFVVYDHFGKMNTTSHTSEYLLSCTDIDMRNKEKRG